MNILVAGGAGFIGSHLCELLIKKNHRVFCVDNLLTGSLDNINQLRKNSRFTFIKHDVIQALQIDAPIDAIFHLASPASPNHHSPKSYHALPWETMMVNTQGTVYLLQLAKAKKAKFLFASTSEVYGDPLAHPQKETYNGNVSTTGPRSVYDEAKRFGETLTAYFGRNGVDTRIARIFNTYGPRMAKNDMRMIIIFINQAIEGAPLTIFGNGTQTRSLCYIDDMITGLHDLMFLKNTKDEIINLGATEEHTVIDYAKMIIKTTGSSSTIIMSEKLPTDDPKRRKPDIEKAKRLLNWYPQITLEEGLKKTIGYYLKDKK